MPILTGTIDDVTGSPIADVPSVRVTVKAPSRRSSLAEQARLVASVPVPVEVSPTGEISVELEPGPAVMLVEGEGLRDVYELGVTADMTLLTEALQEMSPTRSWVESQMVQLRAATVTAAGDAQAAKSDAEGAASVAEGHRTHVDAIRDLLDEAAQTNVAPYLTDTALKATYGTKPELAEKIDTTVAESRYALKSDIPTGLSVAAHGDDAAFPRPDTDSSVIWAGSVEPTEMIDGDLLYLYDPLPGAAYFTDFASATVGGAAPAGWTPQWVPGAWSVATDPTEGKVLRGVDSTAARRLLTWDAPSADADRAEVELVFKWRTNNLTSAVRGVVRGAGAAGAETGYYGSLNTLAVNERGLGKFVGGTHTPSLGGVTGPALPINTWLISRVRVSGDQLQGKTWIATDAEPTDWQHSITDTAVTEPGWVGVLFNFAGTKDISWIGAGTAGRTAPTGA
ncbi:hypothetical protein [Dietzia maris]|uniref:hypothetical protein n=1 Tax=Dietzia maris TaxID=37915 RepID=UPI0037C5537C